MPVSAIRPGTVVPSGGVSIKATHSKVSGPSLPLSLVVVSGSGGTTARSGRGS
jgi:hypothetical protein